jgi:hypothetical protein
MKFLNSIATPIGAALKLIMYFFYVMPVETGIQNAKSEHPDRTIHKMDAGSRSGMTDELLISTLS